MATSASSALLIQHRPGLLWYSMVCLHVCDSAKILLKHLFHLWIWFSSVQSVMPDSLWPHGLQHTRLPCLSPTPRASSNSYPSSRWCHPTIPASVISFSSCLQSFPASGSFLRSQFFTSVGQGIGASTSAQSYQWILKTDFLAIQGSLKSLLQHYSSKASTLQHLAFF